MTLRIADLFQAERFLSGFPGLNGHLAALFLGRAGLTVDRLFALTLEEARALAPEADEVQLVSGRADRAGERGSEAADRLPCRGRASVRHEWLRLTRGSDSV